MRMVQSKTNILQAEYTVQNKGYFCWLQLINAIPKMGKKKRENQKFAGR